jgi:hypothetical protein
MDATAPESPLPRHRAPLDDATFFAAVEGAALTLPEWDHLSHLRAARLLVARLPLSAAIDEMRERIRSLNRRNRVLESDESGYHETVTIAFMHLVASAWVRDPGVTSLDFCIRHRELCDARVLLRHYSRERLWTPEARATFVPPDRLPLPGALRIAS